MKTLFLFIVLAISASAAPITFSYEGAYAPVTDGIFVNLLDDYYDKANNRTVTITASEPIKEFRAHFDNLPFSVGSGFIIYLDDVKVRNTGLGVLVCEALTLSSGEAFTRIRLETNSMPYVLERGTITHLNGIRAYDPLPPATITVISNPEPATLWLLVPALLFCYWKAGRRRERFGPVDGKSSLGG